MNNVKIGGEGLNLNTVKIVNNVKIEATMKRVWSFPSLGTIAAPRGRDKVTKLGKAARSLRAALNRIKRHTMWCATRATNETAEGLPVVWTMDLGDLVAEISKRLKDSAGNNSKLGAVYTWSLPAVLTCPGATDICLSVCYARMLMRLRENVRAAWFRCLALTRHPMFAEALRIALSILPAGQIRIHVSGDFYSARYFLAWSRAVELNPHLAPFAFTRSWRVPSVMAAIDMVRPRWLLASIDSAADTAPSWMRTATIAESTTEHAVKAKKIKPPKDSCPAQLPTAIPVHCDSCGKCAALNPRAGFIPITPSNVIFLLH